MALIDTEEAAKRLARVILSDIELYSRERPREGETMDAQIQAGRRLFASRVTPTIAGLFDVVLEDRRTATARTLAAVAPTPIPSAPIVAEQVPDERTAPDPEPVARIVTPDAVVAAVAVADQPPPPFSGPSPDAPNPEPPPLLAVEQVAGGPVTAPAPAPQVEEIATGPVTAPVPAPQVEEIATGPVTAPVPAPQVEEIATGPVTAPVPAPQVEEIATGPVTAPVPAPQVEPRREGRPFSTLPPTAGAPDVSVPVMQTSRMSIPRLLALVAVAASAVAIIARFML